MDLEATLEVDLVDMDRVIAALALVRGLDEDLVEQGLLGVMATAHPAPSTANLSVNRA